MVPKDTDKGFHLRVHLWVIEAGPVPAESGTAQEEAVLIQGQQGPGAKRVRSLLEQEVAGPSVHLACPQGAWQACLAVTETF